MRLVVIVLLACVWAYLAYGAFTRGQTMLGLLFIAIGVALTGYRLSRR
jgi:hypothetical protein